MLRLRFRELPEASRGPDNLPRANCCAHAVRSTPFVDTFSPTLRFGPFVQLNAEVGRLSGVQRLLMASEDNEKQLRTKVQFLEEDKRQTTAYLEGLVNTTKDQLMASQADNARLNETLGALSKDYEAHKHAA